MYKWRKLDNTAKLFSMDGINNTSIFRFSVLIKDDVEPVLLHKALDMVLHDYPGFKVKCGSGLFWNYLEYNYRKTKVYPEEGIPCRHINFRKNNNYLFRVSYYKNKINLDIYHVLTDGTGGAFFLRAILYRYLELKYNIKHSKKKEYISFEDCTLKYFKRKNLIKKEKINTLKITGKSKKVNNTYHYVLSIREVKSLCKSLHVSVTEYLVSLYIYALYLAYYKENSDKEINLIVPINLRKHYKENTLVNFFTYMNIVSSFNGRCDVSFDDVLDRVKSEFKNKYTREKLDCYLANDVNTGINFPVRVVPLFIKKIFVRVMAFLRVSTSILSNIGVIEVEDKYKDYIDNIFILVMPNKIQKLKCTVCSYGDNLNVTMNSNINDLRFEKIFYELLFKNFKKFDIISNDMKRCEYVSKKHK